MLTGPSAAPSPCVLLQITVLTHHLPRPPPEASFPKQYTSSSEDPTHAPVQRRGFKEASCQLFLEAKRMSHQDTVPR